MKKKLLTLFLATALSLSSVVTAFAVDSPITNGSPSSGSNTEVVKVEVASDESVAKANSGVAVEGFDGKTTASSNVVAGDLKVVEAAIASGQIKGTKHVTFNLSMSGFVNGSATVKVTLPLFDEIAGAKYVETFRVDGNKVTSLGVSAVVEGKFTFSTDHFSTYVFVAKEDAGTNTDSGKDSNTGSDSSTEKTDTTEKTPDTGDTAPVALLFSVAAVALLGIVCVSKKKRA